MIGIIHYGMGNIGSVTNAFSYLGIPSIASGEIHELSTCDKLVLPGVGAFQPAMKILNNKGLDTFIQNWAKDGKALLGICLGMQLLLSQSEENGITKGLGIIPGNVKRIQNGVRKIHIGWNKVIPVFQNNIISESGFAYFVHSFACQPKDKSHIVAETNYGESFASAIQKNSIVGAQFHPEKSQKFGLDILRKFSNGHI